MVGFVQDGNVHFFDTQSVEEEPAHTFKLCNGKESVSAYKKARADSIACRYGVLSSTPSLSVVSSDIFR